MACSTRRAFDKKREGEYPFRSKRLTQCTLASDGRGDEIPGWSVRTPCWKRTKCGKKRRSTSGREVGTTRSLLAGGTGDQSHDEADLGVFSLSSYFVAPGMPEFDREPRFLDIAQDYVPKRTWEGERATVLSLKVETISDRCRVSYV